MRRKGGRYIWFKVSVVVGLLLGLLLLIQSILSYYYVSRRLVEQAAAREAERKLTALEKQVRDSGSRDSAQLANVIEEIQNESPNTLAWIRILDRSGEVMATAGTAEGTPYTPEQVRRAFDERRSASEVRDSPSGRVHVSAHFLRLGPPPPRPSPVSSQVAPSNRPAPGGPSSLPRIAEFAIYLDRISAPFGILRRNLLIGCSAAVALLSAMVLLMVHFGRFVRGKALERELALARHVQRDLLPPSDPVSKDLNFAAECVPAWQVGGDFYDIFATEEGHVALALGDVSGKGLSAALLMALLHGAIRSGPWTSSARQQEHSSKRLNELLCAKSSPDRFASLFWAYFAPEEAVLRYVNAGHPPPAIIRRNDQGELEVRRLGEGGPVLGVLPEIAYYQAEATIHPGDILVIFSDGIIEAMNSREEEFGESRLLAVICENSEGSPNQIRDAILDRVQSFLDGQSPHDDQTLVVVRFQHTLYGHASDELRKSEALESESTR